MNHSSCWGSCSQLLTLSLHRTNVLVNRTASVLGTSRWALLLNTSMCPVSSPLFTAGTAVVQSAASTRGTKSAFTPRSIGSHGGSKEGSNKPPCACWAGSQRHTCCTWLSHAGTGDCLESPDMGIVRWGGRTEHSCTDVVRGVDVGKDQGF